MESPSLSSSWGGDSILDDASENDWSFLSDSDCIAIDSGVFCHDDASDSDRSYLRHIESMAKRHRRILQRLRRQRSDSWWSRWSSSPHELPCTGYCYDCGEVPHELRKNPNYMQGKHLDFEGHDCTDANGVQWRNRTINTDHDLNARDRAHVYTDFRSPRKARKRQRADREKYYSYRGVNRGQLGKEHYKPDKWFGYTIVLQEAETTTMTKRDLYELAQEYPRPPKYHRSHRWDKGYNEKRLQNMHDTKRFDLDEFHYFDFDPEDRALCCAYCMWGTGASGILYGIDGKKLWDGYGKSALRLGNTCTEFGVTEVEDTFEEEVSNADVKEMEEREFEWFDYYYFGIEEYAHLFEEEDFGEDSVMDEPALFAFAQDDFPVWATDDGGILLAQSKRKGVSLYEQQSVEWPPDKGYIIVSPEEDEDDFIFL